MPGVVGAHIDRIAGNHGTAIRFVSQLDTPDDVPAGGRIPVNRRIARLDAPSSASWGATEGAGTTGDDDRLSRLDASDSTQRPLCFVTQCGIVCGRSQRLPGRLCLRSDASQSSGREDTHIEEFILQSFDQLRHCRLRGRADACEGLTRRPSDAGNRIAQGSAKAFVAAGRLRTDGRQGLRRVDADVWILVRKSLDESAYRRAGPLAQSAQGTCGIARDHRILVSQRPSQRRLNPFCMRAPGQSRHRRRCAGWSPDSCRSRSTSSGMAGGPIRRMISKVTTCRSSCRGSRNRLSKGSERPAPWTRAASAVARTFGSLASRRFAQSRTRAGFLERLDSVWGSGDWDSATPWLRPAANIIARACFFRNDLT